MKIELRRLSHNARLSQETNAFAVDIYIDGKKAGDAANSGHGGNTNIHIYDPNLRKQIEAYANTLPPIKGADYELKMNLELLIDTMVEDALIKKSELAQYKRWCKKALMFRIKGDKQGTWRSLTTTYSPASAAMVRQKYGDTLEEILNERPELR
jgi:hypothetical protein